LPGAKAQVYVFLGSVVSILAYTRCAACQGVDQQPTSRPPVRVRTAPPGTSLPMGPGFSWGMRRTGPGTIRAAVSS
jgi:hypothetical protein